MGGISIWQLVIVLVIVMLLFGTKKLRNIGGDLGGAVKGFKNAMTSEEDKKKDDASKPETSVEQNIEQKKADTGTTKTELKDSEKV